MMEFNSTFADSATSDTRDGNQIVIDTLVEKQKDKIEQPQNSFLAQNIFVPCATNLLTGTLNSQGLYKRAKGSITYLPTFQELGYSQVNTAILQGGGSLVSNITGPTTSVTSDYTIPIYYTVEWFNDFAMTNNTDTGVLYSLKVGDVVYNNTTKKFSNLYFKYSFNLFDRSLSSVISNKTKINTLPQELSAILGGLFLSIYLSFDITLLTSPQAILFGNNTNKQVLMSNYFLYTGLSI